ncbi:MAG: Holliday junction resolvase RuvX [Armatimonadota bacterium]
MTEPEPLRWQFPLLGLDVSERRIGLAIAEQYLAAPQPLFTYQRVTRAQDLARCVDWVTRYKIGGVVIGLPVNMDGTHGPRVLWMRRFARELQARIPVPVLLQDERLTTVEAEELLLARGLGWQAREEQVDAVAAALILQRFLDEHQPEGHHG